MSIPYVIDGETDLDSTTINRWIDNINTVPLASITGALAEYEPLANMRAGVVNVLDYGAVGDGETDDTAAFESALDAIDQARGGRLILPSRLYYLPNGIAESVPGLAVQGLGHRYFTPSSDSKQIGAVILTDAEDAWCWTHGDNTASSNEYRGASFENVTFHGGANTAGGLLVRTNNNRVANCAWKEHLTGTGFLAEYPEGGADDTSWNYLESCYAIDNLIGFDIGGERSDPLPNAGSTIVGCITRQTAARGIQYTGVGMRISASNVSVIGGKVESQATGVEITADTGVTVNGMRSERCETGFHFNRPSGYAYGSRYSLIGPVISGTTNVTNAVVVGENNASDLIVLTSFLPVVDNGTNTTILRPGAMKPGNKPTGVAVTAEGIHAALVTIGLIGA